VELAIPRRAKAPEVQTFSRLPSGPGSGQILALVILYELQAIARFPRVQDFVSSCRLVKCAQESGGKRLGTSGKTIGTVPPRWALAAAAVLFLRQRQPGRADFTKLACKHGTATAVTVRAHKLGRAVDSRLTREHAVDLTRSVTA
jgi:transposase